MSSAAAPRCSSVSHEPSDGPEWREVMTGTEETTGAAAADTEEDYFYMTIKYQIDMNEG